MRIERRMVFEYIEEYLPTIYAIAKQSLPKKVPSGNLLVIKLFTDTEEYHQLKEFFKDKPSLNFFETEDEIFSEEERLAAPVLRIRQTAYRGGYPQPVNGTADQNFIGCTFDRSNACSHCTKGMIQNRPYRLSGSISLGKTTDISGIWWVEDYIINDRLKNIILENELTGCEIWPVIMHGADKPFENIFQLKFTGDLPAMAPETNIVYDWARNHPDACSPGADLKGPVIYRGSDLVDIPDFALTKEWFGARGACWRWPFMSQRAYRIFKENNIKGIRYYPPQII